MAGFIKERPDGHTADAMGACYSAGKRKPPPSSSATSISHGPAATRTRNSAPPTSGKARRTQSLCSNSSSNTLPRKPSTDKERSASFGSRTNHGGSVLEPTALKPTKGLATMSEGANCHVHDEERISAACENCIQLLPTNDTSSMMSVMARQISLASGDTIFTSPISNAVDGKDSPVHTPIGNASNATSFKEVACSSDVGVPLAISTIPAAPHSTASSSISSPRRVLRSASSKVLKTNTPPMASTHLEMKSPSLKSGVGAYEVLTPRKQMGSTHSVHGTPLRKVDSSLERAATYNTATGLKVDLIGAGSVAGLKVSESPLKVEASLKGLGGKELCKNCKTSNLDSVCFIANDGRIAAANTGPATVCFHHCNSPKCAANPNYHPPSSLPCKKVLLAKPSLSRSQSDKAKVKDKARAAHENETNSSIKSSLQEDGIASQSCKEERVAHTLHAESGSDCKEVGLDATHDLCGKILEREENSIEGAGGCNFCPENVHVGADLTLPESSPCVKNNERCVFSVHEGDNEFGCCDSVADTTKDSACVDLSNVDLAESDAAKVSQARRVSMERMRQRYLHCLKEQEAESVRLRKQEMIARKQAGEWMLDSAIGEILQKLAPDGEAGVKVLVEAFETIMQHSDSESHHEDAVLVDC